MENELSFSTEAKSTWLRSELGNHTESVRSGWFKLSTKVPFVTRLPVSKLLRLFNTFSAYMYFHLLFCR